MHKHIQWTKLKKGFGPYDHQPRKNLHTAILVNKPQLSVTKHDQTLILAHMYGTSRYTTNTKMYRLDLFLRPVPALAALTYSDDLPYRLDFFFFFFNTCPSTSRLDTLC